MASNLDRKDVTVQEIEGHPPQQNVETTKATWDTDDIHQAALADNPDRAKLPTFTTLLAILVSTHPSCCSLEQNARLTALNSPLVCLL